MSTIKGDFLGFTFDGIHSSELGVFRVSDGSRYTENLLPTIQDKTVQVPGADGTYYFGSFYTQKPISFPISYDNLTEEQLRRLKVIFGDKNIHTLIFDEMPFKEYKVKSTGTPNLKYICFDKPKEQDYREVEIDSGIKSKKQLYEVGARIASSRIYKGEGQLSFTAYAPFARSRFKYLDEYVFQNIPEWGSMDNNTANDVHYNFYDWADASRMILSTTKKDYNELSFQLDVPNNNGVLVYNAGDEPTHFNLVLFFEGKIDSFTIYDGSDIKLKLKDLELKPDDAGIRINGKLNLIEGINENEEATGTIYNKYIIKGDFFKIPVTPEPKLYQFVLEAGEDIINNLQYKIDYYYLYY